MRMQLPAGFPGKRRASAFTLVEMVVSVSIATTLIGGTMAFLLYAEKSISSVTAQTYMTQQSGYALEFIESRIRLATLVSNDASGNVLTLGFDTNYLVDSGNGGNGVAWANQDYFEQIKFIGHNTTNATACATNRLVWVPNTASSNQIVLIPAGLRNLPGHNIFFVTNTVLATICFGVVDTNRQDYYQESDVQTMAASLNHPPNNNLVRILPPP